jgi:cytochrome b561
MPGQNSASRYTSAAIVLHWLIALLMLLACLIFWFIEDIPEDYIRPAIDTHKSLGITVLGLAIMRLLWRYTHPAPALPDDLPLWEQLGAKAAHIGLYLLIFLLPLSGWLHDSAWKKAADFPMELFYLVPWPRIPWIMNQPPELKEQLHAIFGIAHEYLGYALYALVFLHIAGAFKHQFLDKKDFLSRMWWSKKAL